MRLATLSGRAVLISPDGSGALDLTKASEDRFGPTTALVYDNWTEFTHWYSTTSLDFTGAAVPYDSRGLEAPSPTARQVFAIGLNYRAHADESGIAYPDVPPVFTKYATSFSGPETELALPNDTVDWEAELVAVIGRTATNVAANDAWHHIAGLTVGQDYSERTLQLAGPAPQFSLGKSYPGFAAQGPWLVTTDELTNRDDLAIRCTVNGVTVQDSRTNDMIFSIPALIEHLSGVVTLLPGDVIFTGTPAGVGNGRSPKWFLKPGDVVETTIDGIGSLRQTCIKGA